MPSMAGKNLRREEVFKVIESSFENVDSFLELHKNKRLNVAEFLQSLPTNDVANLWTILSELCFKYSSKIVIQEKDQSSDEASIVIDGTESEVKDTLSRIVQWAHLYVTKVKEPVITESLFRIVKSLYDLLLVFSDVCPVLQNKVSLLCESWWTCKLEHKEQVVPNTVLYLVVRSLGDKAKVADIKRVWSMRNAILLLDFNDDCSSAFKKMLLLSTMSSMYLKTEEGSKFISFLFGLHPQFLLEVHKVITLQLPGSPVWALDVYGEVYYRAWRLTEEPYHSMIETDCLQDLMHTAVLSTRVKPNKVFQVYRKVLSYFHQQASQKLVQEMLHRLYKPILWRFLHVANDHVRANAITLMMDAFPLLDPSAGKEESESEVQKQVDKMKELLYDDAVIVRVSVVVGVCHVLSHYWEMLPVHVLKDLLTQLVSDLAFDSSSISVRVAVLQGLCVLLEQRLSHPVLKLLLPVIGNHLHDTAERVRLALMDLLEVVKGMRFIKFWSICPIDHLLARMEIDTPHVTKKIVALLVDSFTPTDQESNIKSCLFLLESNPIAAWKFYQYSLSTLSLREAVKFALHILWYAKHKIESGQDSNTNTEESAVDESTDRDVVLTGTTCVARLLEVVIVLLEGCREKLLDKLKQKVVSGISKLLPILVDYFQDTEHIHIVYWLGTYVTGHSLALKRSMDCLLSQQPGQLHEPLLLAMVCGLNQQDMIIEHIKLGIEVMLQFGEKENRLSTSRNNKKLTILWPMKSLEVLESFLIHPLLNENLKDPSILEDLCGTLKSSMKFIEHIFSNEEAPINSSSDIPVSFIVQCFSLYVRIVIHLKLKFSMCINDPLQDAIKWCETVVLSYFTPQKGAQTNHKRSRNRKRKSSDQPNHIDNSELTLATSLIEVMLRDLCDALLTGLLPSSLDVVVVQFACETAKKGFLHFHSHLSNLLYQLVEFHASSQYCLGNIALESKLQSPGKLLEATLWECANLAEEDSASYHKVWLTLKPSLMNFIATTIRHSCLTLDNVLFPVYSTIAQSLVTSYNAHIVKNPLMKLPSTIQDLSLFAGCMLGLMCKSEDSLRLFLFHLDHLLEMVDSSNTDFILTHISVLHILNSIKEKNMPMVSVIAGKCCGFKQDLSCISKENLTEQLELLCKVHDEVYDNLHKN